MKPETKRWLGIGLIVGPIPLLAVVLASYAVTSFILAAVVGSSHASHHAVASSGELTVLIGNIVNVGLGFLGIVCVLGIFIGIPAGIVLVTMSEIDPDVKKARAKALKKNPHYKKKS